VDLEYALKLLALPRTVGIHPETEELLQQTMDALGPTFGVENKMPACVV